MIIDTFYLELTRQLEEQFTSEKENIKKAADLMSETIKNNGLIHAFGSGHSQMFALELFYRSGGLVPINALIYPQMSVAPVALLSSVFERMENWASQALDMENISEHDVMIIASVSGRNGATVDMALAAKARNIPVIVLTSVAYSSSVPSRHSTGKKLMDLADVIIDIKCPLGDASMEIEGVDSRFGSTSTILGTAVLEACVSQVVENLHNQGITPPLWVSANLESEKGKASNQENMKKYKNQIRFL